MLFNSIEFLLLFLPITLLIYYLLIIRFNNEFHIYFLVLASLFFYGWWEPKYVSIILLSIILNYSFSQLLLRYKKNIRLNKFFLFLGIFLNLILLMYFKYIFFVLESINNFYKINFTFPEIVLPLGISFFTFQQIAFLIDVNKKGMFKKRLNHYFLFVTFFPQLIAGPIVHYQDMINQYYDLKKKIKEVWKNISLGFTLITIGLFKKVIIADKLAIWSDKAFLYSANEGILTFLEGWINVLCFSFQIYFDFSAYSDIALGLALLFGLRLPINFFSPYKATSIIEFWRRWHITLSSFLKNYLYIPLGGNKKGKLNHYFNLFIVMTIGGIWHGAGWTFVLWGMVHGIFLFINHLFNQFKFLNQSHFQNTIIYICFFRFITFLFVTLAWVLFRAENVDSALNIYKSLFGLNGFSLPTHYEYLIGNFSYYLKYLGWNFENLPNYGGGFQIIWVVLMFFWIWFLPNATQLMSNHEVFWRTRDFKFTIEKSYLKWVPYKIYSVLFALIFVFIIVKIFQGQEGEFIYFQF